MKHTLFLLAASLSAASATSLLAQPITVTSFYVESDVFEDELGSNNVNTTSTAIPLNNVLSAISGASLSDTVINVTGDANTYVFDMSVAHVIDNSTPFQQNCCDRANSSSEVYFTADVDATYSISGNYDGTIVDGGSIGSRAQLLDVTSGTVFLFDDSTDSESVGDFMQNQLIGTVGDGNANNFNMGTLTGSLIAGHDYRWRANSGIDVNVAGNETAGSGGSTGRFVLTIEAVNPVPEPSTALLLCLGACYVGSRWQRL